MIGYLNRDGIRLSFEKKDAILFFNILFFIPLFFYFLLKREFYKFINFKNIFLNEYLVYSLPYSMLACGCFFPGARFKLGLSLLGALIKEFCFAAVGGGIFCVTLLERLYPCNGLEQGATFVLGLLATSGLSVLLLRNRLEKSGRWKRFFLLFLSIFLMNYLFYQPVQYFY